MKKRNAFTFRVSFQRKLESSIRKQDPSLRWDDKGRGFTLIELSIVLVIIGLVVGGVLVGQDLIWAAKNREVAKHLEAHKQGYLAFRLKYNCIPGDCTNTSTFFSGLPNGNGNKRIEWNSTESGNAAWRSLDMAGLIPKFEDSGGGYYYNSFPPIDPTGSTWASLVYQAPDYGATLFSPVGQPVPGRAGNTYLVNDNSVSTWNRLAVIKSDRMFEIDNKIDDGLAKKGILQASNNYIDFGETTLGNCYNTTTNAYLFTDTEKNCGLIYFLD